jgi:5-methylcytosine-specific restriction endonuclease McrA
VPEAPPVYRKTKFPRVQQRSASTERFRGSARERGYDRQWDLMSAAYRRKNPFCAFCEQDGRDILCDDVDHMIPVADDGPVHDVENLISLCRPHHNGLKRDLERYARAHGQIGLLPTWCREPETRPEKFRGR